MVDTAGKTVSVGDSVKIGAVSHTTGSTEHLGTPAIGVVTSVGGYAACQHLDNAGNVWTSRHVGTELTILFRKTGLAP